MYLSVIYKLGIQIKYHLHRTVFSKMNYELYDIILIYLPWYNQLKATTINKKWKISIIMVRRKFTFVCVINSDTHRKSDFNN
jgi:hypothetical protein